jgi:two-component system phosphate regulon sensor histidine kinase PhoR
VAGARKRRLSKVGLKLSGSVAAGALLVLIVGEALGLTHSLLGLLVCTLAIAGIAYAASEWHVRRRLDLARLSLKRVRKLRFDHLSMLELPKGDEFNALLWQVYRTGQVMEKEIAALKKIESYRKDYLGNVSHELKTPVFAIKGFAETLLGGALEDEGVRERFVSKILRNTERLQVLTRDLTELTKIETGELKMIHAPFDVAHLAREVIESLEPLAHARGVEVGVRTRGELPHALGDAGRIGQVLTNLVENGIKYNSRGGFVDVVLRVLPSGALKVTVADNGIGLAPQDIGRVTERFFRVDKSRSREAGGTGLGLAIVKHILAAHGSQLQIESKLGTGSSFGFTLPLAKSVPALPPSQSAEAV